MVKTNNKKLLCISTLACSLLLAGCDSITAFPSFYEDPIIEKDDGSSIDVYDNLMSVLYDSIAMGQTQKVLDEFMYIIAQDQFGTYGELHNLVESGTTEEMVSFINDHSSIYYHENDEKLVEQFPSYTLDSLRVERLINLYENVTERIKDVFYDQITSGSYSDRQVFDEKELALAHKYNLYNIDMTGTFYKGYLTPDFTKDNISSVIDLTTGRYNDYIIKSLVPTIYRELLVENYLYKESYSTFGRAYGRKVNIVGITTDDDYKNASSSLVNSFVDEYILDQVDQNAVVNYEILSDAWKGFNGVTKEGKILPMGASETNLLDLAGFTKVTLTADQLLLLDHVVDGSLTSYYKETKLGIMLEKYFLIEEGNRFESAEASAAEAEFTASSTYPKEVGLQIKIAQLAEEDYLTDGWFVKNGGLTELPDSSPDKIRSRLFNISVANEIDRFDADEMETATNHDYNPNNYVRYINNNYYLTPAISQTSSVDPRNFAMSSDGKEYIVQVEEAVSTSKLSSSDDGYASIRPGEGPLFTEETAMEIANVLGTKDSYINSAYGYYIEQYGVTYHDTTIQEFFESTFPDLFED